MQPCLHSREQLDDLIDLHTAVLTDLVIDAAVLRQTKKKLGLIY